jgi:hypothetical protein
MMLAFSHSSMHEGLNLMPSTQSLHCIDLRKLQTMEQLQDQRFSPMMLPHWLRMLSISCFGEVKFSSWRVLLGRMRNCA